MARGGNARKVLPSADQWTLPAFMAYFSKCCGSSAKGLALWGRMVDAGRGRAHWNRDCSVTIWLHANADEIVGTFGTMEAQKAFDREAQSRGEGEAATSNDRGEAQTRRNESPCNYQ